MARNIDIQPDLEFYREQELRTEKRLRDYLTGPQCRVKPKPILRELENNEAKFLRANNPKARRDFATVAARHFQAELERIEGPVFFVTFAFRCDAYDVRDIGENEEVIDCGESTEFESPSLAARIRELLRGYNFLGMEEVAFYGNFRRKASDFPRQILSRHAHILLWGISKRQLSRLISRIKARYPSLLKGMPSADWRTIKPGQEIRALLYSLKSPAWEYRIYPKTEDEARPRAGRLVNGPSDSPWCQRTRSLRPSCLLKVHHALRNSYLDKLAFAGGDGVPLLKAIRDDALKHYRLFEEKRSRRHARGSARSRRNRRVA